MAHVGPVSRWELFRVDLEPAVGSEQRGNRRPALVVSNDGFNAHFDVVTVVPLTGTRGKRREVYPFEVLVPAGAAGNPRDSIAMPQQVRTISKMRLLDSMGVLADPGIQDEIESRLLEHLGIDFEVEYPTTPA
jgi:mRNA interferase MazF